MTITIPTAPIIIPSTLEDYEEPVNSVDDGSDVYEDKRNAGEFEGSQRDDDGEHTDPSELEDPVWIEHYIEENIAKQVQKSLPLIHDVHTRLSLRAELDVLQKEIRSRKEQRARQRDIPLYLKLEEEEEEEEDNKKNSAPILRSIPLRTTSAPSELTRRRNRRKRTKRTSHPRQRPVKVKQAEKRSEDENTGNEGLLGIRPFNEECDEVSTYQLQLRKTRAKRMQRVITPPPPPSPLHAPIRSRSSTEMRRQSIDSHHGYPYMEGKENEEELRFVRDVYEKYENVIRSSLEFRKTLVKRHELASRSLDRAIQEKIMDLSMAPVDRKDMGRPSIDRDAGHVKGSQPAQRPFLVSVSFYPRNNKPHPRMRRMTATNGGSRFYRN